MLLIFCKLSAGKLLFTLDSKPNVNVKVNDWPEAFTKGILAFKLLASSGCIVYLSPSLILCHILKIPVGTLPKLPSGNFTLTFTNPAAGQSGNVILINSGGHTVAAHASVAINADTLTALTTAGTYALAYYCSAASGDNTITVAATGALT